MPDSSSFDGSSRIDIAINESGASGVLREIDKIAAACQRISPEAALSLRGHALRVGIHLDSIVKGAAKVALKTAIEVSPVDTGLFKSNWQTRIGKGHFRAVYPTAEVDPSGERTLAEGLANIENVEREPGDSYYIVNAAHHAKALEEGWSQQAPAGVTQLAKQAAEEFVRSQQNKRVK